jgi:hypothetical protein
LNPPDRRPSPRRLFCGRGGVVGGEAQGSRVAVWKRLSH